MSRIFRSRHEETLRQKCAFLAACRCLAHLSRAEIEALARVFQYQIFYPGAVIVREGDPVDPLKCFMLLSRGEAGVVVKQAPTPFQQHQRQSKFQRGVQKAVASTGMTAHQLLDPWSQHGDACVLILCIDASGRFC